MMKPILLRTLRLFVIVAGALLCLLTVVGAWPGSILLLAPHIRVSSPYCSRWRAATDWSRLKASADLESRLCREARIERRDGRLVLWNTPAGEYWLPADAPANLLPILLAQQQRSIYGPIRPDEVIIDCGAHVGTFSRAALEHGAGLVVAVEPAPDAIECLRRNLASEIATGKAILSPKGIWDSEGALTFWLNPGNGDAGDSFVSRAPGARAVQVPVTTIDALARDLRLPRIDLIKMDVKGATERGLRGAVAVIARHHPRLALSTEDPPEDPAALTRLLATLAPGYRHTCGPCILISGQIRTDVMFFDWPQNR
jgi:FkbM family methyltransferase